MTKIRSRMSERGWWVCVCVCVCVWVGGGGGGVVLEHTKSVAVYFLIYKRFSKVLIQNVQPKDECFYLFCFVFFL